MQVASGMAECPVFNGEILKPQALRELLPKSPIKHTGPKLKWVKNKKWGIIPNCITT